MTEDDTTTIAQHRARRVKETATARPSSAPIPAAAGGPSKSDKVIKLLLRAKGATPLELIAATDWQPHSLRAFLSSLRKKGRSVIREARKNGDFAYRIATVEPAASAVTIAVVLPDPRSDVRAASGDDLAGIGPAGDGSEA